MTSLEYLSSIAGENQAAMIEQPPNANVTRKSRVNAFEYAALSATAATPRMSLVTPGTDVTAAELPELRAVRSGSTEDTGRPAWIRAGTTCFLVFSVTLLVRIVEKIAAEL